MVEVASKPVAMASPSAESHFTLDFDDDDEGLLDLMDDEEEADMAAPIVKRRESVRGPSASVFIAKNSSSNSITSFQRIPKTAAEQVFLMNAIRNLHFIVALDTEEKHQIVDALAPRKVSSDQLLIREFDDGDVFYVIQNGLYEVRKIFDGVDTLVKLYDNYGAFGERSLLYSKKREASVIAKTDGKVWTLDQKTFTELVVLGAQRRQKRRMLMLNNVQIFQFDGMTETAKTQLASVFTMRCYTKDEFIICQGRDGDEMYFIEKGEVRMVWVDENLPKDKQAASAKQVATAGAGGCFGEIAIIKNEPRSCSVLANSDEVVVAVLFRDDFFRILPDAVLQAFTDFCDKYLVLKK